MGNCLELDIAALPSGVRQTFIFWVDQLVTGGSNTFALNVAREILRLRPESEVLFIQTGGAKPGQLEQVELGVNLYTPAGNSANLGANQLTAYYYYLALAAKGKANIALGSPGFWETCEVYGEALKTSTRLGAAFFCSDFDDLGYDRGYSAQYFETLIGTFDFVLTDNESHVAELIDLYGVSKDFLAKVHVLFHPLPGAMGPRKPIDKVQKILWAGRFSRQKGINTLSEIARAMPELTFYIYGGSKSQFTSSTWPNMVFCGEYKAFSECLTSAPDLYLNTSLWDGRQIVLLEAIFHGLPVVTSAVGGIGEIVKYPNTGCQVVASPADPSEYIDILRQTAMSPESVDFRPNEKPDQLLAHHGVKEYSMRISNLLDALGI
jgi:glycosyltransferase involved in cell wall biosynthesis